MIRNPNIEAIDIIKDKIINALLIVFAVIALPLLYLSLSRSVVTGWLPVYYLQTVIFIVFLFLFLFRNKLNYKRKALFSSFLLLVLCLSGLQCLGLFSGIMVFFILLAVLTSLFLGRKYGYWALFLIFMSFTTYAALYGFGFLDYRFDLYNMINMRSLWISQGVILIVVAYSIIVIVTRFEIAYNVLLKKSAQRESEYRLLFEQAAEGIVIFNREGNILMVNDYFRRISGYSNHELTGKSILIFFPEKLHRFVKPVLRKISIRPSSFSNQVLLHKSGEIRFVDVRSVLLPDGRFQALLTDVTKHKKIKKEIEDKKAFEKSLIETLPGVFYVFESYEMLIHWNQGLLNLSGYDESEIKKIHPNHLFVNAQHEIENSLMWQSRNKDSAFFRADLITRNNEKVPLYHSSISYERNGKIYLMGMAYDISGLVKTEQALKDSQENFKNIYNNTSDAIFIFNHNFELLSANETFFSLTGLKNDDLKKINVFDYVFDYKSLTKVAAAINQSKRGRVIVAEYAIKNVNGETFPVEVRSRRITYKGQPAVVTSFNDISARKNLEKKGYALSVKAEEDERGRIAKDLHDGLGPLLSTCKIYLHNLKNIQFSPKEMNSFVKLSELINESLAGVREISNNLSPHVLRNFGLVHALTVFLDKFSAYNEIMIEKKFDASGKYEEIVEITLYRVATELLNNTLKHSGANKVLVELKEKKGHLFFKYTDNGKGFDFDAVEKRKHGLGLYNIEARIKSIGASMVYKTEEGKGVKVEIETSTQS